MSEITEVLAGILAIVFTLAAYLAFFAALFAFIWAVWNWIVLPTMPYIAGLFK